MLVLQHLGMRQKEAETIGKDPCAALEVISCEGGEVIGMDFEHEFLMGNLAWNLKDVYCVIIKLVVFCLNG